MTHPNNLALESFAAGEPLPAVHAAHVEECAACAAFVEELRGVVASGPSAKEADAAVARARARADATGATDAGIESGRGGTPVEEASTGTHQVTRTVAQRARQRRMWMLASSVLTPLAAAAAIVLLARPQPAPQPVDRSSREAPLQAGAAPDRLQMGVLPAPQDPDVQFKGGMQIAVVRERAGRQERFSSTVRVRPGDRLRVELALDHEQAILGAVLADDGTYVELMPLGTRGPGTHLSERSAKIDAAPTRGTIIIGSPEAVARARATRQLVGVGTLRVEGEQP